jgi:hypothetical protein
MTKGLAVIKSSGAALETKHKLTDDADATLGTATAATVSSLNAKTTIRGGASDLATDLNTLSGTIGAETGVAWKIQSSKTRASDISGELGNVAATLGAENTPFDYAAETNGTTYVDDATSFHNADEQLSAQLVASAADLVTLNDVETNVNSVSGMIRKYLKGGEDGQVTYTMTQLETALGDDTGLKAALDARLDLLETTIRGTVNTLDTKGLEDDVTTHENGTVANAASLIGDRLGDFKTISGITGTDASSFAYAPSIKDKDGIAEFVHGAITSVRDADQRLDAAHAHMRGRKDDWVEIGISTANLTVAGSTSFEGDVSFTGIDAEMAVPVYTSISAANTAMLKANSNSFTFYLKVDETNEAFVGDADFPANNKFYFNESLGGEWFPSPFHSEAE